jgi:uncharacterized cupin superfamily protein
MASDKSTLDHVQLVSAPIQRAAIISGDPRARCAELNRSRDGGASTVVWDCTAGEFNWRYGCDETVHILEGEAVIENGPHTHRIQAGDLFIFRAGTAWRWHVPVYVKKIAFLRSPIPGPAAGVIGAMRRLKGLARRGIRVVFRSTVLCWSSSLLVQQLSAIALPAMDALQ